MLYRLKQKTFCGKSMYSVQYLFYIMQLSLKEEKNSKVTQRNESWDYIACVSASLHHPQQVWSWHLLKQFPVLQVLF